MSTLASLQIILGLDDRGMRSGIARSQAQVSKFGAGVQRSLGTVVPLSATLASVAIGKFAMDSFRAAKDFDKAFGQIAAISNATADDIEQWRGQVLGLAGETAKAPTELAEALFFLSSAGIDTSKVMDVLDSSAKAAAVGLGSTTDVAKITANALNAYAGSGLTAARVTDTLVAAVREGSAEPEEFAAALGRILPIASKAGIEFDQVTASLAALSNIGLDVNEGVTAMRGLMTALFAPTAKTQIALKSLGLTADDVRTSLGEDGLIATLRMLEERAGGNIDVMAALVPNVRALTGVFGLTAQEASKVDSIFANVMDSTGSLSQAWGEMSENDAFKVERAFNAIGVAGQKLAAGVLPVLASGMQVIANVIGPIAPALGKIIAAMLLFKAVSFLPELLFSIAVNLDRIGMTKAAGALKGVSVAMKAMGPIAAVIATVVVGANLLHDALFPTDVSFGELAEILTGILHPAFEQGAIDVYQYTAALNAAKEGDFESEAVREVTDELARRATGQEELNQATLGYVAAAAPVIEKLGEYGDAVDEAGKRAKRFAGMSKTAIEELSESLTGELPSIIGTVTTYKETFSLSPNELKKITATWARIGETIAEDLKALANSRLSPEMKAAIAALPPEMRHAWVEGNIKQRRAIESSLTATYKFDSVINRVVNDMLAGGKDAGESFGLGLIGGVDAMVGRIEAAARTAARAAVDAAAHELQIGSPSRVMHKMGLNFSIGFANGIRDGLTDVIAAIQDVVGEGLSKARLLQAKELEAMADDLATRLEKLRDRVRRFRDDIRSGFDFDLIGGAMGLADVLKEQQVSALQAALEAAREVEAPDQALIDSLNAQIEALRDALIVPTAAEFGVFLEQQLATAQRFARGLKALQAAGLDPKLLADLASRGPESLPFIEALLAGGADIIASFNETQSAINEIAGNAADRLVDEVFGARLDRAAERVAEFAEQVAAFVKGIHAEAVAAEADELIKALQRLSKMLDNMTDGAGGNGRGRDRSADMVGESPAVVTGGGTGGAIDYERMAAAIIEAMRRAGPMWQPIPVPDVLGIMARTGSGRMPT